MNDYGCTIEELHYLIKFVRQNAKSLAFINFTRRTLCFLAVFENFFFLHPSFSIRTGNQI